MNSVASIANTSLSPRGQYPVLFPRIRVSLPPAVADELRALVSAFLKRIRRNGWLKGSLCVLIGTWMLAALPAVALAQVATTTALAVTSGGNAVTTVASGSVVTLTATVKAGTTPVMAGAVKFCDAMAKYCTDIHLLGTAQLTMAGTASFKFRPASGSHSYNAVFAGTPNGLSDYKGSTSSTTALTVTSALPPYPTATAIAMSGSPGNYTLTATVAANGSTAPTGTISFLDTSYWSGVLGTATLGAGTAGFNFVGSTWNADGEPNAIALGDFNGDGIPDLAVMYIFSLGQYYISPSIMLGNGDGTFTDPPIYPGTGSLFSSIAVGDFNGDGNLDLAFDGTILLGKGDGTFESVTSSSETGSNPYSVVAGDFNGDGILDLAVAYESSNAVGILLGNGDGTLEPTINSPTTGSHPNAIAVGDFNGDGILDLAVANCGADPTCSTNGTVTILLGDGDGTFTAASTSPPTGIDPKAVVVGDFNGDGILDLAVVNYGDNTVSILLGNKGGTFTPAKVSPSTGYYPVSIAVGDFNGDGIPDLTVVNKCGNDPSCSTDQTNPHGTITILLGKGDGTFTPTSLSPATGNSPYAIAVGDFTGYGIQDLAVTNTGSSTVTVLLKENQTATATATGIAVPVATGTNPVVANYSGDSNYKASTSTPIQLTALKGTPTVSVVATPNPAPVGGTFTLNSTVTGGGWGPTGSVTYTSGIELLGSTYINNYGVVLPLTIHSPPLGTHTITASYSGDSNFIKASSTVQLTVLPSQTITFAQPITPVRYGAQITLSASSTSGLPVTFSVVTGPGKVNGNVLTFSGVGYVGVTANQAGNSDYAEAIPVLRSILVGKASLTIHANNASAGLDWTIPKLTYTLTGFVNGETSSVVSGAPVETTTATKGSPIGNYPIEISQGTLSAANYGGWATVNGILSIKKPQTITFTQPTSPVRYGVTPITLSASASSGLPVSLTVDGPATLNGSTLTITGVGTVVLRANQAGNSSYTVAAQVVREIVVDKADLTIHATSASVAVNKPIPSLTYTLTGFVNGDTASVVSGAPVETTTAKQGSAAGKYPITITAGTLSAANYGGWAVVDGTLTITQ